MTQPPTVRFITEALLQDEIDSAKNYADSEVEKDRKRLSAIEGRELPNRGRLYPLAIAPSGAEGYTSIDEVLIAGRYSIWSVADARALGLPAYVGASTLTVYAFGNIVEHELTVYYSASMQKIARRSINNVWNEWSNPGAFDGDIAAQLTPGKKSYKAVTDAIKELTPQGGGVKTAAMSLTTGQSTSKEAGAPKSFRQPFKINAPIRKYRFHIHNSNPRYGNKSLGAISFHGIGIGRHVGNGEFSELAVLAENVASGANGEEYVTPWSTTGISQGVEYLITAGYTLASTTEVNLNVGGGWVTGSPSDWNVPAPAALTESRSMPFYIWLELVVDNDVPVIMYFGDSLSSGVSAKQGMYDSWPNKHAMAHGHIATHYTNSGSAMAEHLSATDWKWTRYRNTESPLAPPNACWFSMGSNDIFGSATMEDMEARYETCIRIIRDKFTPNIGLTTILPRHNGGDSKEILRKEWNHILKTAKANSVIVTVDNAPLITSPDGNTLDKDYTASPTDIHLTGAGYGRYMQPVPPLH